jgi:hypothetical protein
MSSRHWESTCFSVWRRKTSLPLYSQGGSPQRRWNWVCKCCSYPLWGLKF